MAAPIQEHLALGSKIRLGFSILLYRENKWSIAHCLEMDLPAEGGTPAEALKNLTDLMDYQIQTALAEGDLESIFSPAPPELWKSFAVAGDWILDESSKPTLRAVLQIRELGSGAV